MNKALVSIVIPTYNSDKFISDSLESVLNQSYIYWEVILVDDASIDTTVAIAQKYADVDNRIKIIQLSKNSGTGVARNKALAVAKGKFISFLDADDLWKPTKLEQQLAFMEAHKLVFTFSFYECIDEQGKSLHKRVEAPRKLTYRQLFFCNYIGNLTAIYDTDFFGKIPISSIRKRQDWMLWLTVLKKIKIAQAVPESLAYYRVRNNSISTSKLDLIKYNFAVYRQFHGFNFLKAAVCMTLFLFTQLCVKPFYSKQIKAMK